MCIAIISRQAESLLLNAGARLLAPGLVGLRVQVRGMHLIFQTVDMTKSVGLLLKEWNRRGAFYIQWQHPVRPIAW
jgi:hypothetical protein